MHLGQPQPTGASTTPPPTQPPERMASTIFMKAPAAKPPQIQTEMTHPQLPKFKMDWNVVKKITNIPPSQIHTQLYSNCRDTVQTTLVNTVTNFQT